MSDKKEIKPGVYCGIRAETLESRILYSADTGAFMALLDNDTGLAVQQVDDTLLELLDTTSPRIALSSYTDIVVIDSSVPESHLISDEFANSETTLVLSLHDTENGIDTIGSYLSQMQNVQAIQIFSHSDGSSFQLGSALVDNLSLQLNESKFNLWQDSLSGSADILIYGCNLAGSVAGLQLINDLALFTGADVAASDDLTGHESRSGDWELEFSTGDIDPDNLVSDYFADNWEHVLATLNVTTHADTTDGDTSSIAQLLANRGADGLISLREAITAANNTGGFDHIRLSTGTYNLLPANGEIVITDAISITGDDLASTKIDAANASRIFNIQGADVTIRDLTLANGSSSGQGGALLINGGNTTLDTVSILGATSSGQGGAINASNGHIEIIDSRLTGNTSSASGAAIFMANTGSADIRGTTFELNTSGDDGGAIYSSTNLTVADSIFDRNSANDDGSTIYSSGFATVTGSTFTSNMTISGGGTIVNYGTMQLTTSYFFDNSTGTSGAGIHNNSSAIISDSTFHMNNAATYGGAIASNLNGSTHVSNSTFYLNTAGDAGGAIAMASIGTSLSGSHLTFSTNQAGTTGGAVSVASTNATISNSIFDNNTASSSFQHMDGNYSTGFNLFTNTPNTATALGDIINGNAALGLLQDNGGLVPTMRPQTFSDAIDSGSGQSRVDAIGNNSNEFPDMGAVEYLSPGNTNKVYWTDENGQAIYRANESGGTNPILWAVQKIADTTDAPTDIEIHTIQGRLYWAETDGDFGRIMTSELDGRNQFVALDNSQDSGFLAPHGIALDEENDRLYLTSDLYGNNDDGSGTQSNSIRLYNINGDPTSGYSYSFDSIVYAAIATDPLPIARPQDIEYMINPTTGDEWLVWTDIGFGAIPEPSITLANLSTTPADLLLMSIPVPFSVPVGVAWNTNNELAYIADNILNLTAVEFDEPAATATIAIGPQYIGITHAASGIHYDPVRDMVWYTEAPAGSSSGSIWTADSLLQGHNQAQGTINDPTSITLVAASRVEQNFDLLVERPTVLEFNSVVITNADLAATDPDTSSNLLTYSVATTPAHGHLELVSTPGIAIVNFTQDQIDNGQVVYVHTGSAVATDEFFFDVTDGTYTKSQQRFTINIEPVNDAPLAGNATTTLWENSSSNSFEYNSAIHANLNALVNDPDPGDLLTFSLDQPASAGAVSINTDGTFLYSHGVNEQFSDSFSYLVTDSSGLSDTGTITLTVNPVNDIAPVAVNDTLTVNEGALANQLTGGFNSVLDNDFDLDVPSGTLQANLLAGPAFDAQSGTVTINSDGTFTYQHDGSETVSDRFYYTVSDFQHAPVTGWVDVSIVLQNDNPPSVPDDLIRLDEGGVATTFIGGRTSLTDGFSDLDVVDNQSNATVTLLTGPTAGTLTLGPNDTFTYLHNHSETFADSFTYLVTDTGNNSVTVTATIQIVPINENSPFVADNSVTLNEGAGATQFDDGHIRLTDGWIDDDFDDTLLNVSVSLINAPSFGTLAINPDNTFDYTHDGSENFTDSFVYRLTDTAGNTHDVTTSIQISPVNEHSPFVPDNTLTLNEGASTTQFDNGLTRLTDGWVDDDFDDTLLNVSVSLINAPSFGTLAINPDNTFDYTHDGSENFTDSFIYRLTDTAGNAHNVTTSIQINPVNEHSPFVPDNTLTLNEGASSNTLDNGFTGLIDALVDADTADNSNTVGVSPLSSPAFGNLTINPDGTFNYSHDGSENFTDSFIYRLTDTAGNTHDTTVSIQINPVNEHDPFVADTTMTVLEGGSSTSLDNGYTNLGQGLVDADFADSPATVGITLVSAPLYGVLLLNNDNTFNYTHDGSENFTDSFIYRLTDTAGNTHDATVSIQAISVNNPPTAGDSSITTDEDSEYSFAVSDFSFNDPAEHHAFASVIIKSIPATGSLSINGLGVNPDTVIPVTDIQAGNLLYAPAENANGAALAQFTYTVVDTGGTLNGGIDTSQQPAVLTINVDPINDNPVATGIVSDISMTENTNFSTTLPSTLFSDADNDPLALTLTMADGSPLPGWITYETANGVLTLDPTSADTGTHSLALSATDNPNGAPATVLFQLNVIDINDPPTAINPSSASVNENSGGVLVTPLTVIDADLTQSHTLQVDDPRFEIINNELWLKQGTSLDFESEPSVSLMISVTDSVNTSIFPLLLEVIDLNDPPLAAVDQISLTAIVGEPINLDGIAFTDQDQSELDMSVTQTDGTPLPDWLSFHAPSRQLVFIGEQDDWPVSGGIDLLLVASDAQASSDSTLVNVTLAPALATALPDQPDLIETADEDFHSSVNTTVSTDEVTAATTEEKPDNSNESVAMVALPASVEKIHVDPATSLLGYVAEPITAAGTFKVTSNHYSIPDSKSDVKRNETKPIQQQQLQPIQISLAQLMQPELVNFDLHLNLVKQLDTQKENLEKRRVSVERIETVSFGVTTGVSVGYILWMIRSGAVLASMVTALPAWRAIDPLPILASFDEEDDSDQESLQSMVDSKTDDSQTPKSPDLDSRLTKRAS